MNPGHRRPLPPADQPDSGTTIVFVQERGAPPTAAEREHIDRFVAAFLAKKGVLPSGDWKVPGVGYCVFLRPYRPA